MEIQYLQQAKAVYKEECYRFDRFFFYLICIHIPIIAIASSTYSVYSLSLVPSITIVLVLAIMHYFVRGQQIMRIAYGIALMLFSGILIMSQLGRIEMHFHIFGSLAFLLIYKDWRPIVAATITIARSCRSLEAHLAKAWCSKLLVIIASPSCQGKSFNKIDKAEVQPLVNKKRELSSIPKKDVTVCNDSVKTSGQLSGGIVENCCTAWVTSTGFGQLVPALFK